jgi:hypothetical protein
VSWRDLSPVYEESGFVNPAILLREIQLPQLVSQAIEEKVKAEQDAQRMVFVLQKEQQEAERKRIEAKGIPALSQEPRFDVIDFETDMVNPLAFGLEEFSQMERLPGRCQLC